jgi:hypothetical protein
MSFLIYLLIFFILPYFSTSSYIYGTIRNASIKLPFDIPEDLGHKLIVKHCNDCFCYAFRNSDKVQLFTCTKNASDNFTCQFYYFMPKRDEIDYPRYDTNIYLINKTARFEEKDDCCNTTYLIEQINKTNRQISPAKNHLRSIAYNDNNDTMVAAIPGNSNSNPRLIIFNRSSLEILNNIWNIDPLKTVGYSKRRYYVGTESGVIKVYDDTLNSLIYDITTLGKVELMTIRFLNESQMIVGTSSNVYIFEKKDYETDFTNNNTRIDAVKSLHAIGIVNDSAFYVGSSDPNQNLRLYTKGENNLWTKNVNGQINRNEKTSDIFIDKKCGRIWATQENGDPNIPNIRKISIYDQNKTHQGTIDLNSGTIFNLMIFENYTLIISHENDDSLSLIRPSLNCRPPR